jgi:hypothetical protein
VARQVPVTERVTVGFDVQGRTDVAGEMSGGIESRLPSALTRRAAQLDAFQQELTGGANDVGPTRGVDQSAIAEGAKGGLTGLGHYTVTTSSSGEVKGVVTAMPLPQSAIDAGSEFITARQYENEMNQRAEEAYQARLRREAAAAARESAGQGPAQTEVINPDGSRTTTYHGADGDTIITTYTDGTSEVEHSDGRIYYYDAQGNPTEPENVNTTPRSTTNPDATRTGDPEEFVTEEGSTTWVDDGTGDIWTAFPDGTTQVNHPDGTTETFHPDGSHTETYPDGSSSTVDKDGNVVEHPPPRDDATGGQTDQSGSSNEGSSSDETTGSDGGDDGDASEGSSGGDSGDADADEHEASSPIDETPPEVEALLAAGRAYGFHPGAARAHGSTGTGGDVDPADPAFDNGLDLGGPLVDWKRTLLVGPADPEIVGGTGRGTIPDSIQPGSGVIDPSDDAATGPGGMGPEDDPFGGMQPGLEPGAPDAADDGGVAGFQLLDDAVQLTRRLGLRPTADPVAGIGLADLDDLDG